MRNSFSFLAITIIISAATIAVSRAAENDGTSLPQRFLTCARELESLTPPTFEEWRPLQKAIMDHNWRLGSELITSLSHRGRTFNFHYDKRLTFLGYALEWGAPLQFVELAIAKGADPSVPSAYGLYPFQVIAVGYPNLEILKVLHQKGGIPNGSLALTEALSHAILEGFDEVVEFLLTLNPDLNLVNPDPEVYRSPFMFNVVSPRKSFRDHSALIEKLVRIHGAPLEDTDPQGITALMHAMLSSHLNMSHFNNIKALISVGANIHHVAKAGGTILDALERYELNFANATTAGSFENTSLREGLPLSGPNTILKEISALRICLLNAGVKQGTRLFQMPPPEYADRQRQEYRRDTAAGPSHSGGVSSVQQARSILGVSSSASKEEITKAFRKLALETHPDVNPAPDAEARFKKVRAAYDYLTSN